MAKYFKTNFNLADYPVLSAKEERELIFTYKFSKDERIKKEAHDELILRNQGLIYSIIRKYLDQTGNYSPEFFISYGECGLKEALDKFDLSRKLRFSTYAYFWVEKEVRKGIREETCSVHIPDAIYDKFPTFNRVYKELKDILDREPTSRPFSVDCGDFSEMEEALVNGGYGFTPELYKRVEECWELRCVNSLDAIRYDDDKNRVTLLDTIADEKGIKERKSFEMNQTLRDEFEKIRHADPSELKNPEFVADVMNYILDHPECGEEQLAEGLGITRSVFRTSRKNGFDYLKKHSEVLRMYCDEIK